MVAALQALLRFLFSLQPDDDFGGPLWWLFGDMKPLKRLTADAFRSEGLRGANCLTIAQADVDALRALGADHARLWLTIRWDGRAYVADPADLQRVDASIAMLQRVGAYAVLTFSCPDETHEPWGDDARLQALCTRMAALAKRYRLRTAVAAFDVLNEPDPPASLSRIERAQAWGRVLLACAKAIRGADPQRVIVWQGVQGYPPWMADMVPLALPNCVPSLHSYLPHALTHQNTEEFNRQPRAFDASKVLAYGPQQHEDMLASLREARAWQLRHRIPALYVGEFSCANWAEGAAQYIADSLQAFRGYGWAWCYHAWRSWEGWDAEAVPNGLQPNYMRSAQTPTVQVLRAAMRR